MFKHFDKTWKIYEALTNWIGSEKQDAHSISKPLSAKLTPTILKTIKDIFTKEHALQMPSILDPKILYNLFLLLKKVDSFAHDF